MSEKIDVLEVIDGPSIEELYTLELPIIKDDEQADSENERILKRSQLYWKDYLAEKNYNKDINKMCTICREDQIKAHGKITIPCKGLADISCKYSAEEVKYLEEEVYSKEDMGIRNMVKKYAKNNPKFTKKNHERNENLNEIQLGKWYTGLLGKSTNLISKNSI